MKVLTMQLNSITVMDLIAYGGAALGVIMAVTQYVNNHVSLAGCLLIILLAADFFLPMRQLGSFFHIAMNGMAASDKIFRLLDLPEHKQKVSESFPMRHDAVCSNLRFSYEAEGRFYTAWICSSTRAALPPGWGKRMWEIHHRRHPHGAEQGYTGSAAIGGVELKDINENSLLQISPISAIRAIYSRARCGTT